MNEIATMPNPMMTIFFRPWLSPLAVGVVPLGVSSYILAPLEATTTELQSSKVVAAQELQEKTTQDDGKRVGVEM
jgi:hypothetical protein